MGLDEDDYLIGVSLTRQARRNALLGWRKSVDSTNVSTQGRGARGVAGETGQGQGHPLARRGERGPGHPTATENGFGKRANDEYTRSRGSRG